MNTKNILSKIEAPYLKSEYPKFRPGDTLRVHVKVVEGESERIQPFEGVVIARKGSGLSETYTVRKISFGVGIERTFPLHSPRVAKIEWIKSGKARRAKLYYLRNLSGKAARLDEKETSSDSSNAMKSTASKTQSSENHSEAQKKTNPEPALSH